MSSNVKAKPVVRRFSDYYQSEDPYVQKHLADFEAAMTEFEGPFMRHPYLDTLGVRTVCRGKNVNNRNVFTAQPWQIADLWQPANTAEIQAGYTQIGTAPYGQNHEAEDFEDYTNLRLPEEYCQSLYKQDLDYYYNQLAENIPNFYRMTLPMRLAMLERHYNTGSLNSEKAWPKLYEHSAAFKDQEDICSNLHTDEYDKHGRPIANMDRRNASAYQKCMEEPLFY